jgi:hypothetical protein
MSSPEPNISELESAVEKSGKPLEMVVSAYLEKLGWESISNTDTFYDREGGKLRDVDICASLHKRPLRVGNLELETYLIAECKKDSKHAWVFFSRPREFDLEDLSGHYVDEIQMATRNTENLEIMNAILGNTNLHYKNMNKVAVTSDIVPLYPPKNYDPQYSKQTKKKNPIFTAQNQLKKYLDWSIDREIRKRSQVLPYSIEIYFPCLILQGHMYEATVMEDGKVKLEKRNHVILETLYRSRYSVYERNVLIDIFSDDFQAEKPFWNFQELIRQDIQSIERKVSEKADEIGRRMSDTLELIESTHRIEQ